MKKNLILTLLLTLSLLGCVFGNNESSSDQAPKASPQEKEEAVAFFKKVIEADNDNDVDTFFNLICIPPEGLTEKDKEILRATPAIQSFINDNQTITYEINEIRSNKNGIIINHNRTTGNETLENEEMLLIRKPSIENPNLCLPF